MEKLVNPSDPFPRQLTETTWILGNYHFNLYLIKGNSSSALVEMAVSSVVDEVIRQLKQLDTKPDYLILTHPHADHLTGFPGLIEAFPDADPVVAAGACEFIEHPKARQAFVSDDRFLNRAMADLGYPPGRPAIEEIGTIDPGLVVPESTSLDLGGLTADLHQSAGHSPGSLMVHVPAERAVFVSDSLGFHFNGRCLLPLYFTGYEPYLETLEKIESFSPALIGPAHQGPFVGKAAEIALAEALRSTPEFYNRIREDRKADDELAEALFQENYRDEFAIYTPENILNCCRLLVKRSRHS